MRLKLPIIFSLAIALLLSVSAVALERPTQQEEDAAPQRRVSIDNLPNPLAAQRSALRLRAVEQKVQGLTKGTVAQAAPGQFVQLEVEGTGMVWSLAAEFGNTADPDYGGPPGPRHNNIPEPNRTTDNVTIWRSNFNRAYYEELLFSGAPGARSLRNYYLEQSSGRFTITGDVAGWERVPFTAARYGSNQCGEAVCTTVWDFVQHSIDKWYSSRQAAGKSAAAIDSYLAQFDIWDRND